MSIIEKQTNTLLSASGKDNRMKIYETPFIEIVKLTTADVITESIAIEPDEDETDAISME